MPAEVLETSTELADQAIGMFRDEATNDTVGEWLRSEPEMAEVEWDSDVIRFRLEEGRSFWLFRSSTRGTRGSLNSNRQSSAARTPGQVLPSVAASGEDQKQAVVLSPMLWDFGESDDGAQVAEILRNTRGYEKGVRFLANQTRDSMEVGIDQFRDLEPYEVVHVVSHGAVLCKTEPCRAVIIAGRAIVQDGALPNGVKKLQAGHVLDTRGFDFVVNESEPEVPFVALTADFFRDNYPGGLQDKVIFVNTCESLAPEATDLVAAMKGTNSVYFGWDDSVNSEDAKDAALGLYEELAVKGKPTEVGYEDLGNLRQDRGGTTLVMKGADEGDLRIREVVWLLQPDTNTLLSPASSFVILGTIGDGESDLVRYSVAVDGMPLELAENSTLHVAVDGVEGEPQKVSTGASGADDRWLLSGEIDLGYDLQEAKTADLRAWVELGDEGESDHEVTVTLTGEDSHGTWEMNFEWSRTPLGDADDPAVPERATGRLLFEYADFQNPTNSLDTYELVGGTITYDPSHQDRFCIVSADPITFEVTPEMVGISSLEVDDTVSPAEYGLYVSIDGPQYTAEYACSPGTGKDAPAPYSQKSTKTRYVSLRIADIELEEQRTLSDTATSASGTWKDENLSNPGAIRLTEYNLNLIDDKN